jgi:hypothetical protein
MIRKAYWAKSSGGMEMKDMPHHEEMMDPLHIDHCIDTIRQYMMCNPDVTATTWVWDADEQKSKAVADVAHTCRNFDDVKAWAIERRMRVPFQRDVHVMGS